MGLATTMRRWWRRADGHAVAASDEPRPPPQPQATAAAAAAPPRATATLREFFRYHGVMAPGVRLLRNLPMGAKLGVVAAAFVLPLTFMTLGLLMDLDHQLGEAKAQAAALERWRLVDAGRDALRLQRLVHVAAQLPAPPTVPVPPERLDAGALARLARADAPPNGAGASDWRRLQTAMARVAGTADGAAARFEALLDASDELLNYVHALGQGSLVREPGQPQAEHAWFATYHLARLAQRLAAVADLAALAQAAPADEALRFQLRLRVPELERAYGEAVAAGERLTEAGLWPSPGLLLDVVPLVKNIHDKAVGHRSDLGTAELAGGLVADAFAAHEALRRLQAAAIAELDERLAARRGQLERRGAIFVAALVLLGAVPVYLLLALYRVMAGGMVKVIEEVRRMSSGDLSERPEAQGRDEVAGALRSLSTSLAMLGDMFSHVRQGAAAVAHASGEIARGNTDLDRRTLDSREGLERVVDAVRACVALLDQCGRRVDETVAVVDAMRLDAAKSRANMAALDKRMQDLRRKSGEIDAIVGLIDGIAFRTNILALNASIESAKAGDAGRGFSVVAQEVRRLAGRSADNARQISEIIGAAREDIERGAALADHTGGDLTSTDALMRQVHEAMRGVVQLTRQGQQRSQQVLDEVRGLMTLTEANGDLVHQIADASQALSAQGEELSRRVENFKLT